jgi:two-component sensor histidine kinase
MCVRFPTFEGHSVAVPATIIPANEPQRMAAVKRYEILDTPADGSFDRITSIAARRFNVPISIISIVDNDRIWFKSHHGLDAKQIDREPGLCASAILKPEPHILLDASKDVRSLANPLVAGDFGLRFYAGVPLNTSDGHNLGTLCVIDKEPRPITEEQIEDLKDLAAMVMDQLEFRLAAIRSLANADRALAQANLLAREIDHRVMNSLQFVSAMLHLQGKGVSEAVGGQLDAAANRVAAVARVHRHFHLEKDTAQVPALTYLRRLCDDLSGLLGVPVDVEGEPDLLPTTSIQPLGLIVNELVTNAAKHGAGKINVTYKSGDADRELIVCDQGAGLPAGFDPTQNIRGLGMKIVDVLAKQLGGTMAAGQNPSGTGACFAVTFPR